MAKVTATSVLAMLQTHQVALNQEWDYPRIKPFTITEVEDFLAGRPGLSVGNYGYTRSSQVIQAVSAIGANLVDAGVADETTQTTYKAIWAIKVKVMCEYCGKPFSNTLMMGKRNHCNKSRCLLMAMRASV